MSKMLKCKTEGCENKVKVSNNIKAVTCSYCVSKMVGAPKTYNSSPNLTPHYSMNSETGMSEPTSPVGVRKRGRPRIHPVKVKSDLQIKATNWPRCWWLKKEFAAPDGNIYHKGKLAS